jgi:hypothetical protein
LGLAAALLFTGSLAAQDLTGVVRDAATGEGIPQARVAVEREGRAVTSVATDAEGRFRVRMQDSVPVTLVVERLGYMGIRLTLDHELPDWEGLEILLEGRPVELPGIDAEVERERLEFRIGGTGWRITERGLFFHGRDARGMRSQTRDCTYLIVDSVVVRDPRLFLPEVREGHQPSRGYFEGITVYHSHAPDQIADPRLRRDAWPCAVTGILRKRQGPYVVRRSTPERDAPDHTVDEAGRYRFSPDLADPRIPGAVAVHSDGRLAALAADGSGVEVLSGAGERLRSVRLNEPGSGAGGISRRLGWLGDTLWIADQVAERLILFPPGREPERGPREVREREGVLAPVPEGPILSPVDETLPAPLAMDRPVPVPAANGRFLWTRPAPDAPYPPRHPDDPPGRFLVVLDPEWRVERVLATLRPGADPVNVELGTRPVIGEQPFRDPPLWALSPDGAHVTVVEREHQVAAWMSIYRVVRLTLEGDTIFAVERPAPMVRVSDEAFEVARDELAARPGATEGLGTGPMSRAVVGGLLYRPPFHPPISTLVVGRDGSTWLRWPDDGSGPVRWDVLDGEGRPLRTLDLPREFRILAADGREVWGVVPREEGGFDVVCYGLRPVEVRIGRPAGPGPTTLMQSPPSPPSASPPRTAPAPPWSCRPKG